MNIRSVGPETTPRRCGEFADRLQDAIDRLAAAGMSVPSASRLPSAVRALSRVAKTDAFPTADQKRTELLDAIRDAAEWPLISMVYKDALLGTVKEDMRRAIKGKLGSRTGPSLQLQAQLFFGAILRQDGKPIAAPVNQGLPDFIISDGNLAHGVEVKAPFARSGLSRAVSKARTQLKRPSGGGMLVIDASALIESDLAALEVNPPNYATLESTVNNSFDELVGAVRMLVPTPGPWRRHQGIVVTVFVARAHAWIPTLAGPRPASVIAAVAERYFRASGSLTYLRATMLRDRIGTGLKATWPNVDLNW